MRLRRYVDHEIIVALSATMAPTAWTRAARPFCKRREIVKDEAKSTAKNAS